MIGGEVALVAGPLLYFLFFGREISMEEFCGIAGTALVAGVFGTILATIFVAALYKELRKKAPSASE